MAVRRYEISLLVKYFLYNEIKPNEIPNHFTLIFFAAEGKSYYVAIATSNGDLFINEDNMLFLFCLYNNNNNNNKHQK